MGNFQIDNTLELLLENMASKKVPLVMFDPDQVKAIRYEQRKMQHIEKIRAEAEKRGEDPNTAEAEFSGDEYEVTIEAIRSSSIDVRVRALTASDAEEIVEARFREGEYDGEFQDEDRYELEYVTSRKVKR
jgi:hypothetical protein